MTPRVWRAGPDEAEAVARLLVEFRNYFGRDWPSENAFLAGVEKLIETVDTDFLLAAVDDDSPPTGVAQLRFRHGIWHAATDCWLEDIFVLPEARRKGVAKALVEFAFVQAEARGCRRIELDVSEVNDSALELYTSLGFGFKSDPARDLMMTRALNPD